jgi:penicillin amidase
MPRRLALFAAAVLPLLVACKSSSDGAKAGSAPAPDAAPASQFASVPISETLTAGGLSAPVEVVRDDVGIPHIFGKTDADVAYAQGYMMASDRFPQMELGRRQASGTLAEMFGSLRPDLIDLDIKYRTHHLRRNAEATWASLQASTDPLDQKTVAVLSHFTAGVNAWQADLAAGKRSLPPELSNYYAPNTIAPWSEIDSLALGELQAFTLAFDADSEIELSKLELAETTQFHGSVDPVKAARDGVVADLFRFAPFVETYTVDGWPNAKLAAANQKKARRGTARAAPAASTLALLTKDERAVRGLGLDRIGEPDRGSNNWVVSGRLTASGNAIVSNDTHLSLAQPAVFYLSHLHSDEGLNVMGTQFPGIPLVILGMNEHIAWGSTVSYIDVTDVYREAVKDCDSGKCVVFNGQDVKLSSRVETINIGLGGRIAGSKDVTLYEVPHHGPIVLRSQAGVVEPLGAEELSIRYTGHEPAPLIKAVRDLVMAKNVDEGRAALEKYFKYGGQNWVIADTSGNILWTQAIRAPRRPKGTQPWKVMPGDGSAEWAGDQDVKDLPAGKNPDKGFFATANADPLGVTADNDPMNEPEVAGYPSYLGYDYDPGTRVGRITSRILDGTSGGRKLSRDDMASIQADRVSILGQTVAPAFLEGAQALAQELATPGAHPALTSLVAGMSADAKAALAPATEAMTAWSFDTPAGNDGETPEQLRDSRATLLAAAFTNRVARAAIGDEITALGGTLGGGRAIKLLANLIKNPTALKVGAALWDDMTTPEVETRATIVARSVASTLDFMVTNPALGPSPDRWRWGAVHHIASNFPIPGLMDQPLTPRPGGIGTVDVASHEITTDAFDYKTGPAIRFVAELDPAKGPVARNVIPGGEVFRKDSPHFGDLFALWVKNEATDLAFRSDEILPRALKEQSEHGLGRIVFTPSAP